MNAPTITPLDCGWLRQQERMLVSYGSRKYIDIPVPSWLVRHPDGNVVFDVGLHSDLVHGSTSLGSLANVFTPIVDEGGTVGPRLAEQQVDPTGPLLVVLSHCHFDHVGGLNELPNARVVVQGEEWDIAGEAGGGYLPELFDLGHDLIRLDGEHDMFGDGLVTVVPTPGHTCGHQSLRVATADGPVILAADACYFAETLDGGELPPFGHDIPQQRRSLEMLQREQAKGTLIVPGHDAEVFRSMASKI